MRRRLHRATMLGFYGVARLTGFWETTVPADLLAQGYRIAAFLGH